MKNVEVMNEHFVNITKNLNIPAYMIETLPDNIDVKCRVPIDGIIHSYSKHPSILKINIFVNHTKTFSTNKVNQSQIEKEILELNPKKSAGYDAIPSKVIKDAFKVSKSPLTQLFNTSIEETLFPIISNMLLLNLWIRKMTILIRRTIGQLVSYLPSQKVLNG